MICLIAHNTQISKHKRYNLLFTLITLKSTNVKHITRQKTKTTDNQQHLKTIEIDIFNNQQRAAICLT